VISERTKAALAAAKQRGIKIGGYRGTKIPKAALKAPSRAIKRRADARAADLAPTITELQAAGATSLRYCGWAQRTTNPGSSLR
jgi:DNA invertase Pin-like site-specific DNA recombinase